MNKLTSLELNTTVHHLIVEGIRRNKPQLCRVADLESDIKHSTTFAFVTWVQTEGGYLFITTTGTVGDRYRWAIPIKLVSKPRPLAEILDWFEERGWKHKEDGWHAPYCCGVAEVEESEGRSFTFFGNARIQLIEEERFGLFSWHEDWLESEYVNL